MKELAFVVWDVGEKEQKLLYSIEVYVRKLFNGQQVKIHIDDLKTLGEKNYDIPCVVFGSLADSCAEYKERWLVPDLKMMLPNHENFMTHKKTTMDTLLQAATAVLEAKEPEPVTTHVETPEGITVGADGCQINITEAEATHLKNIKNILGGGKMVITKGDLKIEVSG